MKAFYSEIYSRTYYLMSKNYLYYVKFLYNTVDIDKTFYLGNSSFFIFSYYFYYLFILTTDIKYFLNFNDKMDFGYE